MKNFLLKAVYGFAGGLLAAVTVGADAFAHSPTPANVDPFTAKALTVAVVAIGTGLAAVAKRGLAWLASR